jgi:hypothetical protein
MEIVTFVLSGSLAHKDSLGNTSTLRAGDVQRMTAGLGIVHSEWNPSATDPLHLLQIWIVPRTRGLDPGYEELHLDLSSSAGESRVVAFPDDSSGSLKIH